MAKQKLTHQDKIENFVKMAKSNWEKGFMPDVSNWEQYERELREEMSHMNAAEINEYYAAFKD